MLELTEKLALEVGLPVPVSNQSMPVSSVLQEHLSGNGFSSQLRDREERTAIQLKSKNTVLERSQNANLSDVTVVYPKTGKCPQQE